MSISQQMVDGMHSPSVFFLFKNWNLFLKVYYTEIIKEMFFCIWTHEILFLIECKKIHKS